MLQSLRKKYAVIVTSLCMALIPVVAPAIVSAQNNDIQKCLGQGSTLKISDGNACNAGDTTQGTTKVNTLITDIVNIFSAIVGIVSVIMIIYGGFRYITSGGDSGNVTSAKNTIVYAVLGLVVVAMAQFIVQFVLNKVTSN